MAERVSIIVPVYNVERYVAQTLESIIAQSYHNIEIIVVNDGSGDGSGEICDSFAQRDSRIRVHHTPNCGVAKARELGYKESTGEFIAFVDSDDVLPCEAIERLRAKMESDVDIVIGANSILRNGTTIAGQQAERYLSREEHLEMMISWRGKVAPWGRLFRRELFGERSFPNLRHTQDLLMNVEVASRARRVRMIEDEVYCYRHRDDSTTRSFGSSLDYERSFCTALRDTLMQCGLLEEYNLARYRCQLKVLYRYIVGGSRIGRNEPLVVETQQNLRGAKITPKERFRLASLRCRSLQWVICTLRSARDFIRR